MSDNPDTSEFFKLLLIVSHPDPLVYISLGIDWDAYVISEAFGRECEAQSKRFSSSSGSFESSEHYRLWDKDDTSSMTSDSSTHAIPKIEAYLYYYGLCGDRRLGPKLIYRTSTDIYKGPSEPEQDPRKIQLLTTHKHAKLDEHDLWPTIREEVRVFLKV
jgi:hypothetical protein